MPAGGYEAPRPASLSDGRKRPSARAGCSIPPRVRESSWPPAHGLALLDEVQRVPGGIADPRLPVSDGVRLLDDNGHWRFARELSRKAESIDGDLFTAGRPPAASARN